MPSKLQQSLLSPPSSKLQHSLLLSSSSSTSSTSSNANGTAVASTAQTVQASTPSYVDVDRSDSGLGGSSRTLNSSDERSGSHSSAFSGSDDHTAATSPLNDQHPMPPFPFNHGLPVWRDPNMIQSVDGPIRHVDSVQHQSIYMSNTKQMPLPYQPFHPPAILPPPPSIQQPVMSAGGMLWKPPVVGDSSSNYYREKIDDHLRQNRGNCAEKDVYREIKKVKPPSYLRGPIQTGKRVGGVPIENGSNEYGQVEIERMINHRHQRGDNREHIEKQQAEAAVHQHFEESLKLAQQQRRTNWISKLPSPPKNVFPNQGHISQDTSKQRPAPHQMTNNRGVDEWKEKKNRYAPPKLTPIGPSSSRLPTQQGSYRLEAVPKSNYDHENIMVNDNEGVGNHNNNMISYAPYNTNHAYAPSISSVIVRNESSYKNPSIPAPEVYANNHTPTILTVPDIKIDSTAEPKHAKPINYPRSLSSVNTSQLKTQETLEEPYPGPLLNTHGRYTLYPPSCQLSNQIDTTSLNRNSTTTAQKNLNKPPPAHLNAIMTSVLPKFTPVAAPPSVDFQAEPLNLAVVCNNQSLNSDKRKTDVPLHLYSGHNNNDKPNSQKTTNLCSINICAKAKHLDNLEKSLPSNMNSSSLSTVVNSMTISSAKSITIPTSISSTILTNNPENISITISKTILSTIPTETLTTTFATSPTTMSSTTSSIIVTKAISTQLSSTSATTNLPIRDSSPSTPPPVLMPATYTEMACGIKTHHHKLKKAWLQRHVWAEDLKEAGVNIDQSPSNSFSQLDDTPPVLQCEITKKRKNSKSAPETSEVSQCDSDIEPQSLNDSNKKSKKRKVSNSTTISENKSVTESDKESDLIVEKKVLPIKIPKKRGRKPKVVVKIPLRKKSNNDTEVRFFQSGPCLNAGPKIYKCRECRIFINNKKKDTTTQDEIDNIFCRFYAFRRLFTNKYGQLMNAGFPDPIRDVTPEDLNLWMPNEKSPPSSLDVDVAKKVLVEAGRQFCYLVKEENKALSLSPFFQDKPIAWKKAANGVREMCDVCLTTIFNYHWACAKCGFGVCIDCVKSRLNGTAEAPNAASMTKKDLRERDKFMWMTCNNKANHEIDRLMLTQIVAGDSMDKVFTNMHEMCTLWNILLECGCPDHPFPVTLQDETNSDLDDDNDSKKLKDTSNADEKLKSSPANVAINEPQVAGSSNSRRVSAPSNTPRREKMKHFVRKKNKYLKTIPREPLPPRVMTLAESRELFPDNPHTWLCDGKLLRLLDPENPTNCDIFQEQWKRGQPVMVSDVGQRLNPNLWSPNSFCRDFGVYTNDLIDCATGLLVEGKTMKEFWDGFEDETKRLKDSDGNKMLLKLKDWPVAADFSETLPERFDDLMRALPLKDYTQRDGKLNLASRLPTCFVRPDLGPKMYSAYGNAGNRDPGKQLLSTTNLHLDVSDAVNVMVFVAITQNGEEDNENETDHDWHIKEAYRAVDEAGCDMASRRRAREPKEFPGAVWHIYDARDADSIRDLLNKVSAEQGEPLEPNHDPIHDQSSYLDADLRARLYNEYGVQGYAVLQCLGDAIFIPAGAPHQVRNLHNCIKVAEDFVSPENVSQCFRLMNEFRDLSSSHSNHEDKLQIKNIMYHAIKDSMSVLLHEHLRIQPV